MYLLAERDIEARAGEIERVEPSLAMRRRNRRGAVTPVPIRLSGPGRRSDGFHAVASPVKRRIGGLVAVGLALAVATMVAVAPCRGALADYADGQSAFERGDWDTARSVWRPLAESGDAAAQNGLGYLFRHGRGVTQDSAAALLWYRRAAERGYAPAQFNLGLMYDHGVGVAQDFAVAALWFRRAAVQGIARAQTFLGFMYWAGKGVPGDRAKALFWLRRAAATDPMARQNLPALQSAATAAERANADALLDDWRETLKVPDAE